MIDQLYSIFQKSTGVSTDTRSLQKNNLWFALRGPNFNANKFAKQALDMGAIAVVVDDPNFLINEQCVLVEDGLTALQKLANHHRKQFDIPFIGITGSNGKTTTKELVRDVLSQKFKVLATKGNLNNHIGVPLTLLKVTDDIEIAIIEMGANHQGEIAHLCEIAEPEFGLITNIGKAHLEGFGGIEGVFKGKTELYSHLASIEGVIFLNSNNIDLVNKAQRLVKDVYSFPQEGDSCSFQSVSNHPNVILKTSSGKELRSNLSGAYNFENICAALCIGKYFGVDEEKSILAVAEYKPENNRSQVVQRNSNSIHMDAYNANPSSMSLSVQNFASETGNKVAILGDMFELGDQSEQEHKAIGELTSVLNLDTVIFCGELMKSAHLANPDSLYFSEKEDLQNYLKTNKIEDSVILIKGSRGMSLETLLDDL